MGCWCRNAEKVAYTDLVLEPLMDGCSVLMMDSLIATMTTVLMAVLMARLVVHLLHSHFDALGHVTETQR